jgi:hypothetical protein
MRELTADQTLLISGGFLASEVRPPDDITVTATRIGPSNPNACSSALLGASGWIGGLGAIIGGAIGSLAGPLGTVAGAFLGSVLGGSAAGGYTAQNNPACLPPPAP